MVTAASAALFASSEHASFSSWAEVYYGQNYKTLAAKKASKLPPIDDALSFASLQHTADDEFSRSLSSSSFWRKRGGSNASKYIKTVKKSNLIGSNRDLFFDPFNSYNTERSIKRAPQSGLYRTMCVRSCDGYMWPVSFSTSKSNLGVDEKVCRNSCAAPTRLYYYENPGQEPSEMVDRRGRSYNRLPTAWRFQQQRVASCKCRPDPWEPQAMARHAMFAKLKQQGRLKRYLRKASRKAQRLSRRASIGSIIINSSVTETAEPTVKRVSKRKTKRRIAQSRKKKWFVPKGASGFSSKSYKSKKSYSAYGGGGSKAFRRAFRTDR